MPVQLQNLVAFYLSFVEKRVPYFCFFLSYILKLILKDHTSCIYFAIEITKSMDKDKGKRQKNHQESLPRDDHAQKYILIIKYYILLMLYSAYYFVT